MAYCIMQVHVLSAAYSPGHPASGQRQVAVIRGVYMMMGRALERLKVSSRGMDYTNFLWCSPSQKERVQHS
jgi:hypothetical protein